MRLEHIGIAVADIEAAIETFSRLLGKVPYKTEHVASEQVDTHFLWVDGVKIELLSASSRDSPIRKFLKKRGDGLHHLAFEVDDLTATSDRLSNAGFTIIGEETKGKEDAGQGNAAGKNGADGKRVFFLHPNDTNRVLIECCSRSDSGLAPVESAEIPNGEIFVYGHRLDYSNSPVVLLTIGAERYEALRPAEIIPMLEPTYPVYHIHLMDEETDIISLLNNDILSGVRGKGVNLLTLGISSFEFGLGMIDSTRLTALSWIHVDPHRSMPRTSPPDIPCLFITSKSPDKVARWPVAVLPRTAINPLRPTQDALIPIFRAFWEN